MIHKKFFKTRNECEVTFECSRGQSRSADLLCEANGWQAIPMKRTREGSFRARVRLPRGERFQFRYRLDGSSWVNDEAADAYCPNEFGSENSVVSTVNGS